MKLNYCALTFRSSSIFESLSLISLVKIEVSQSLPNNEVTLLKDVFDELRIVDKSTWWIKICYATSSKSLLTNFFSALCNNLSCPSKSSLHLWTTPANWYKIGWELSTSIPRASIKIFLASSMILNSLSLSSLSLCCLTFFWRSSPKVYIWFGLSLEMSQFGITISSSLLPPPFLFLYSKILCSVEAWS